MPTKTSKKDQSFYNAVSLIKPYYFTIFKSVNTVKDIFSQHSQKPYLTDFTANVFLVGVKKNICTEPFLDAKELHS